MKKIFENVILGPVILICSLWVGYGGVYHAFTAHSATDGFVSAFIPPYAVYRSIEFFWHKKDNNHGASIAHKEKNNNKYEGLDNFLGSVLEKIEIRDEGVYKYFNSDKEKLKSLLSMVRRGMNRLSVEEVLGYLVINDEILQRASPLTCAGYYHSDLFNLDKIRTKLEYSKALEEISDTNRDMFAEIWAEAIVAEVLDTERQMKLKSKDYIISIKELDHILIELKVLEGKVASADLLEREEKYADLMCKLNSTLLSKIRTLPFEFQKKWVVATLSREYDLMQKNGEE